MGKKIVLTGVTLTDLDAPTLLSGENLLLNGSFESSLTTGVGVFAGNEVREFEDTVGVTDGEQSMKVTTTGTGTEGVYLYTGEELGGSSRTFIGAADVTGSTSVQAFLRAYYTDASSDVGSLSSPVTLDPSEPTRITSPTITTNAGKTLNLIRFYIRLASSATVATFYVDSAKVNEGAIAPPYTDPETVP